jgi:hypothetical protein
VGGGVTVGPAAVLDNLPAEQLDLDAEELGAGAVGVGRGGEDGGQEVGVGGHVSASLPQAR